MKRPWLAPLTPLYAAGVALRNLRLRIGLEPVRRLRWPVVSIGNLSTGGSGKTPLTIALAEALTERGFQVDVLSRGYGRTSRLAARVDPKGTAEEFGDEPLLIAREAGVPVYVAARRYEAGLMAEFAAPDSTNSGVHLLDDGFQHRQLHRDVEILLINGEDWADSLLPAGNLREPLKAHRRASVIAIPANEPTVEADLRNYGWQGPIWRLHRKMEAPAVEGPVAAFCGIARPEQFFEGLIASGLEIVARAEFADHHRYRVADLERLKATAWQAGACALVTTEKDLVRIGRRAERLRDAVPLETVRLRVEIEGENEAVEWLIERLASCRPHPPL